MALPLQIYIFAQNASDTWTEHAWGASLVLIGLVLVFSIAARFATRSRFGAGAGD
jgi:phosphate transport system permease protein